MIYELGDQQWDIPELRRFLEDILPEKKEMSDFQVSCEFPDIGHRTFLLNARQLQQKSDSRKILLALEDISERAKE